MSNRDRNRSKRRSILSHAETPEQIERIKRRQREKNRQKQMSGKVHYERAKRLMAGHRMRNYGAHHEGIAAAKDMLGDSRPEGMTLSLIHATGPDTYWGPWCIMWKGAYRRRLSTNPNDYAWESERDNKMRNPQDNENYLGQGLLIITEGPAPQWARRIYLGPLDNEPTLIEWLQNGTSDVKKQLLEEVKKWGIV